jgi:hypothetical protein
MAKYSQKQGGKEVGPASVYAEPHTMSGKPLALKDVGIKPKMVPREQEWTPMCGVAISNSITTESRDVKTDGIKIRGTGAATKGTMARGPMA